MKKIIFMWLAVLLGCVSVAQAQSAVTVHFLPISSVEDNPIAEALSACVSKKLSALEGVTLSYGKEGWIEDDQSLMDTAAVIRAAGVNDGLLLAGRLYSMTDGQLAFLTLIGAATGKVATQRVIIANNAKMEEGCERLAQLVEKDIRRRAASLQTPAEPMVPAATVGAPAAPVP